MLDNLPQDSAIKVGESIVTSGVGNYYPSNIRIGTVLNISVDNSTISKQAILKPYTDFTTLKEVIVIVPKDNSEVKYNSEIKN